MIENIIKLSPIIIPLMGFLWFIAYKHPKGYKKIFFFITSIAISINIFALLTLTLDITFYIFNNNERIKNSEKEIINLINDNINDNNDRILEISKIYNSGSNDKEKNNFLEQNNTLEKGKKILIRITPKNSLDTKKIEYIKTPKKLISNIDNIFYFKSLKEDSQEMNNKLGIYFTVFIYEFFIGIYLLFLFNIGNILEIEKKNKFQKIMEKMKGKNTKWF